MSLLRNRIPVDVEALRVAVGAVQDPDIHRPLAELGMLRAVSVGRGGRVELEVALTTPDGPVDQLRDAITAAVAAIPGATGVELRLGVLSDSERMHVAQLLQAQLPPADPVTGARSPARRVFAVASGKGGVGKSSVTANIAVALAAAGQRVGVLDADVWGYSVPHLFGVRRSPVALKGVMLPVEAYGVKLMSTGFFVDDEEPVVWRGPMLHKALEQFIADVHWGELDVLLCDLPPGTGDITLSLLELLPEAALLAVTTPQPAAQTVAARVGKMTRDMRMPIAGVVENMSALVCDGCGAPTPLFGAGGGQRLADQLGTTLLGRVPLDLALREAGDAGKPVVLADPTAVSAMELSRIAATLPAVRRSLAGLALPLSVV